MAWMKASAELGALLQSAVERFDCQKRVMFGSPAYFANDNMFTGVFGDSIFIRLSPSDREAIAGAFDEAAPFEPMPGRAMREYVVIPPLLYDDASALDDWLERSHRFALSLAPKPRKGKKPTTS